ELRRRTAEIVGDRLERTDAVVRLRVGERTLQPLVPGERAATPVRNAVEIFAGEQARRERTPDREAETDLVVQPGVLELDTHPPQQVVLRLLHRGLVEMMTFGDLPRGADLVGRPLRRPAVVGLAA